MRVPKAYRSALPRTAAAGRPLISVPLALRSFGIGSDSDDTDSSSGVHLRTSTIAGIGVGIVLGLALIIFLILLTFYYRRKSLRVAKEREEAAIQQQQEQQQQQQHLIIPGRESQFTGGLSPWSPYSDPKLSPQTQQQSPYLYPYNQYQEVGPRPASVPLCELGTESEVSGPAEMDATGAIHEAPPSARDEREPQNRSPPRNP